MNIMRYFEIGKNFEYDEKSNGLHRWYYDYNDGNQLTSCIIKDNAEHCLPQILANDYFLKKYFFFDIKKMELGSNDYVSVEKHNLDFDFGESFAKNISNSTFIDFYPKENKLKVSGLETYSRRTDGKTRYYPAKYIANRVRWFLSVSPFVESFNEKQNGLNYCFYIKFKE